MAMFDLDIPKDIHTVNTNKYFLLYIIYTPGNGNRGGRGGIFGIPPPGRKFFENTPPGDFGQAAILFFK